LIQNDKKNTPHIYRRRIPENRTSGPGTEPTTCKRCKTPGSFKPFGNRLKLQEDGSAMEETPKVYQTFCIPCGTAFSNPCLEVCSNCGTKTVNHEQYQLELIEKKSDPVLRSGKLLAGQMKSPSYCVTPILPNPATVVLVAKRAMFKTSLVTHIGIMVSRGTLACGAFHTTKGNVLIIDGENGDYLSQLYCQRFGVKASDEGKFYTVDMHEFFASISAKAKANPKTNYEQVFSDYLKRMEIKLVIIDSLRRAYGGDENDSGAMSEFLTRMKIISNSSESTILMLHHERKGATGEKRADEDTDRLEKVRGSSDITAAVDVVLQVNRQTESNLLELYITKNRFGLEATYTVEKITDEKTGIESFSASFGSLEKSGMLRSKMAYWLINAYPAVADAVVSTRDILDKFEFWGYSKKTGENYISELKSSDWFVELKSKKGQHCLDMIKVADYFNKQKILDSDGKPIDQMQSKLDASQPRSEEGVGVDEFRRPTPPQSPLNQGV